MNQSRTKIETMGAGERARKGKNPIRSVANKYLTTSLLVVCRYYLLYIDPLPLPKGC